MDPATGETRLAENRRASLEEPVVADVRVIDVEQSTEEPDDLDGRHEPLRDSAPPRVLRGSARDQRVTPWGGIFNYVLATTVA
jgi:hypothetical protein